MFKQNNRYGQLNQSQQINPMYLSRKSNEAHGPTIDINISYENYIPDDQIAIQKKKYGNELLEQIRLNNEKKRLEKQKQLQEELDEERRLAIERERLTLLHKNKNKENTNELMQRKEKNRLIEEQIEELKSKKGQTKSRKISSSVIDINPFKELIEEKVKDRKEYNNDMIEEMRKMYNDYTRKVKEIDDQLKYIKMMILHSNLYKVDMVQELIDLRNALIAKKYQEDFKRDHIYKEFKMSQKRKKEINEFYANNQYKLPIINLSHHILSPGIRLNNEWYYNDKIYDKESQPDIEKCYHLLNNTNKQMCRMNRYDEDIFY